MRKNVFGRQLKRDRNERKALFKGLMSSLVLNERIKTTEQKAKAIKGQVEKLVTKAKKKGDASFNQLQEYLTADAISKLIKDVAPRFEKTNGGYTRIIKIGNRLKDNAGMAFIEWTSIKQQVAVIEKPKRKKEQKKEVKEEKKPVAKKAVKKERKKEIK